MVIINFQWLYLKSTDPDYNRVNGTFIRMTKVKLLETFEKSGESHKYKIDSTLLDTLSEKPRNISENFPNWV